MNLDVSAIRLLSAAAACLLLWQLALPTGAAGKPTKPASGELKLRAETLTPKDRQAYYLKLLEGFAGWAETNNTFVSSDELEPGGGYFAAAGAGVRWARGNGGLCITYAVLLTSFPGRQRFSVHQIPRSQLEDHLRKAMRSVCLANKNCSRHNPGKFDWGGPSWQAALEFIGVAWAAHLQEKRLDADTLALVKDARARQHRRRRLHVEHPAACLCGE
jgi:hypothetical protein